MAEAYLSVPDGQAQNAKRLTNSFAMLLRSHLMAKAYPSVSDGQAQKCRVGMK